MKKSIAACAHRVFASRFLLLFAPAVVVLSVVPASRAQDFTCPVTKPVHITFEPVGVFAEKRASMLGTERLFTLFPGNWHTVQRTDRGYRIPKLLWGTKAVDLHQEIGRSSLTLTGRRLDAEAGPLQAWDANTAWTDPLTRNGFTGERTPVAEINKDQFFITSEIHVPTRGCWEVTGHFHGEELKIVIDVK